jgi:hypothetical protein
MRGLLTFVGLTAFACMAAWNATFGLVFAVILLAVAYALYRPSTSAVQIFGLYLIPLFAFARVYSYVGISPIYLPEVLLLAGLAVSLPHWWPVYQEFVPRNFKLLTVGFAAVAAVATWHGIASGYDDAVKGLAFVVYPLVSAPVAAWIRVSSVRWHQILTLALSASPLGLVIMLFIDESLVVSAAYGFYIAGLIGVVMCRRPGLLRTALAADALLGILVLASTGKRGPVLTILIALFVAQYFAGGKMSPSIGRLLPAGAFASALLIALLTLGGVAPRGLPGIGTAISRTQEVFSRDSNESEANVAFRFELWRYALRTAASEGPLLGTGFGRPFALEFRGVDLAKDDTGGAHNSFVGIAYYMGYPALLMFMAMVVLAARRVGRRRVATGLVPAQAAWLAAGVVTLFTNVALEAPYIGGPFWLLLGWCAITQPVDSDDVPAPDNVSLRG